LPMGLPSDGCAMVRPRIAMRLPFQAFEEMFRRNLQKPHIQAAFAVFKECARLDSNQ
jgi:hypothetical protein